MIIVGVILEVTKLSDKRGMPFIGMAVFLGGIILNAMAFSKANNADITFGQAFGSGFRATAIVAIVMVVWSFISLMIFPDIYDRAIEKAQNDMSNKGEMSEEQMDMAINFTKKYFKVLMVAGALFGTLVMGAIFSLVGAAIAKKAPRQRVNIQ
jgi:hypothetical protein